MGDFKVVKTPLSQFTSKLASVLVSSSVVAAGMVALSNPAQAYTFGFKNISNNNATNAAAGESLLGFNLTDAGSNKVKFEFFNNDANPNSSISITSIYFDDSATNALGSLSNINQLTQSSGVNYKISTGNLNLPAGNTVGFTATDGVAPNSQGGVAKNGIDNSGEKLGVTFSLTSGVSYAQLLERVQTGKVKVGIHVQSFSNGGSEAFVNKPCDKDGTLCPKKVPEPASMLGLVAIAGAAVSLKRKQTVAEQAVAE